MSNAIRRLNGVYFVNGMAFRSLAGVGEYLHLSQTGKETRLISNDSLETFTRARAESFSNKQLLS